MAFLMMMYSAALSRRRSAFTSGRCLAALPFLFSILISSWLDPISSNVSLMVLRRCGDWQGIPEIVSPYAELATEKWTH